jgi:hypothetical protein
MPTKGLAEGTRMTGRRQWLIERKVGYPSTCEVQIAKKPNAAHQSAACRIPTVRAGDWLS